MISKSVCVLLLTSFLFPLGTMASGQTAAGNGDAKADETDKADKEEKEEKKDPKKLARKVEKVTRDLELARIELQIAELSARIESDSARAAVEKAKASLGEAKLALEHFKEHEQPVAREKADIDLDRSSNRADHAKDELDELVAMYTAEEFAEMTKELVLKRGRRNLELAERSLAIERRKVDMLDRHDLPKQLRDKQTKLKEATEAMQKASLQQEKTALSTQLSLLKARQKIQSLEVDLGDAREELEKLDTAEEAVRQ